MDGLIALARPAVVYSMTLARAPGSVAAANEPGPGSDQIVVEPYRPAWPGQFRVEAEVLRTALASLAPRLEHIGSTAVPGLASIPVVDLLLGVHRPADLDAHAARLRNFGYVLGPRANDAEPSHRVLVRSVRGVRTHHVYVVEAFSNAWHRPLLFRDLLRIDTQLAVEYGQLKRTLAARHANNRIAYTAGKTAFIQAVLGVQPT